ncbi:MAG TPA: MYXO-CTERM sorting domain-containing protein, partial [Polyangiaceae bacterium]
VLADGIYRHTIGVGQTWPTYSLTLPKTPCAKCTIQIIQVMLDHPSNLGNLPDGAPNPDGFLYHHCIDISIAASDGGSVSTPDGGGSVGTPDGGGTVGIPDGGSGAGPGPGMGTADGGSDLSGSDSGSNAGSGNGATSSGCGCATAAGGAATGNALALVGLAVLLRRRAKRRTRGGLRAR